MEKVRFKGAEGLAKPATVSELETEPRPNPESPVWFPLHVTDLLFSYKVVFKLL